MKSCFCVLVLTSCAALAFSQGSPQSQSQAKPSGQTSTAPPSAPPSPSAASGTAASPSGVSNDGLKARGPEAVAAQDPNRVVATIGGKPLTARQALDLLKPIAPQQRARFQSNLEGLIQHIYMDDQLADEAIKMNLDKESPVKEQLQLTRAEVLAQAYLNKIANSATGATTEDPKQYYDAHPADFDQLKLSGIFIAFSPPGTPASGNPAANRTEEQAREKVDDLEKKIKAGGDFGALARTDNDNPQWAAKGGEIGTFMTGEGTLPPEIKDAILKLKPGEATEPLRRPNGFIIIKVDSRTKLPFEQVRANITQRLQNEKDQAAVKQQVDKYKIEIKDPDFFNASNAPARATPSLQRPAGTAVPAPTPNAGAAAPPKPQAQR
jgi:peptidyl-prolyl cis-trans isomerase C